MIQKNTHDIILCEKILEILHTAGPPPCFHKTLKICVSLFPPQDHRVAEVNDQDAHPPSDPRLGQGQPPVGHSKPLMN